ncbi:MAG: type II secretion system protein [Phycisphaerales bacterium]|nr:type II secretion system protein [Phycisphaerales bacterium]
MNLRTHHPRPATRRGFTLIEVIIAAVLLVVLGTMLVPRMSGIARGELDVAIESVNTIVATFAFAEATDEKLVALSYSEENRRFDVFVLDADDAGEVDWRPLSLAPSLILPDQIAFTRVTVDGAAYDPSDWFVSSNPSGLRPDIRIRIESDTGDGAEVALLPHGLGPVIIRDGDPNPPVLRERADLNEMGADREDW